jgi:Methyltransferase domain/galactosyl transferase GMA12/MNN10 family/Glycosyl transferase family 2
VAHPSEESAVPRKVLCSLGCGPQAELLEITRQSFELYAERHGYDLVIEEQTLDSSRPPQWSKILLLQRLLRDYDVVVWVDADAIFVDASRDIAEELEPGRFLYFAQHRFGGMDAANTGVLVLRACPEADAFLAGAWERTEYIHHPYWEQAAMLALLGYEVDPPTRTRLVRPSHYMSGVKLLSSEWNSIVADSARRPRVKHYAGEPHELRLAGLRQDLEQLRRSESVDRPATPAAERLAASVVLPLQGPPERAWQWFLSLAELPDEPAHEVVVVDDGSGRYDQLLSQLAGGVKIVRSPRWLGFAAAAGRGVAAAEGAAVVLLRGVSPHEHGWLAPLLDALAVPGVGAAEALPTLPSGPALTASDAYAIERSLLLELGGVPESAPPELELDQLSGAIEARGLEVRRLAPKAVVHPLSDGAVAGATTTVGLPLSARAELPALLNDRGLVGCGVEVGVQLGLFSEHLLEHWHGRRLISVDPWLAADADEYVDIANVPQHLQDERFAATCERLARFGARSSVWRMTGMEACKRTAPGTLDFVYLDARHDYDTVKLELDAWYDKLRPGGVFAGHDYLDGHIPEGIFGVRSAVNEFFAKLGLEVHATSADGPWVSWVVELPLGGVAAPALPAPAGAASA